MRPLRSILAVLAAVAALAACSGDGETAGSTTTSTASTSASTTSPAEGPSGQEWWCHPELVDDPCLAADLRTTRVDFALMPGVEDVPPAADPLADCFFVPPDGDDEEVSEWARVNAARFRTVCPVFVPNQTSAAYDRVASAFERYLAEAGDRPFVLLGHDEGGDFVTRLVQERVATDPAVAARLVSAVVVGRAGAQVTNDGTPGGTFPTFPLCSSSDQTGCVITFQVYEDGTTPVAGQPPFADVAPQNSPACTNPAGLGGGRGQLRAATFPVESSLVPPPIVAGLPPVETPFITLPEYYLAECLSLVSGTVELWIGRTIDPDDQRQPGPLDDPAAGPEGARHQAFTLAMGDLIQIIEDQSEAFAEG
jgi:hypothetical protein